jgi:malonyl-CoA/methylmalonyl-CoA synthetase
MLTPNKIHPGTTGKPKGVLTTLHNIESQVSSLQKAWHWSPTDKILLVLPLHHVHGVINVLTCCLASGATLEILPEKFSAEETWNRFMEPQRDLTLFMAVPTIYAKLAERYRTGFSDDVKRAASDACSQFRLMVSGSAALPAPLFDSWKTISGHELLER